MCVCVCVVVLQVSPPSLRIVKSEITCDIVCILQSTTKHYVTTSMHFSICLSSAGLGGLKSISASQVTNTHTNIHTCG